ncbi:nuclear factor 7, brain-like [Amblyraja radiata]|uniref:nuclear factor 7, brain-like n=1 Tax=Amblyraja radiata TaxID=386614 RepID=UPI001402A16A|nr:nuclear factor 7, brain-like [Amblyraja radiata]
MATGIQNLINEGPELSEKARALSLNLKEKESKLHCEKHQEELKLFCETDKKLICLNCATAQEHKTHSFMLIDEAIEFYKEQVKSSFESLTEKKSVIEQMEQQQKENISGVQEESHNLQSQITSQFAELHQIFTEKEQRFLGDIREEEKKIVKRMKKNLQDIQENLNSIQEELSKLQEQIDHKADVIFLKDEAGRESSASVDTESLSVTDAAPAFETIYRPFVLSTMITEISDAIKRFSFSPYVSVTLDVETAHARLEGPHLLVKTRHCGIGRYMNPLPVGMVYLEQIAMLEAGIDVGAAAVTETQSGMTRETNRRDRKSCLVV